MRKGGWVMSTVSEKELSGINELLGSEELLVKKFKILAEQAEDSATKSMFEEISATHQRHYNQLYSQL